MKIRASVLWNIGAERPYAQSRPLAMEQLDLEGPRAGEVLLAVRAAGLCHSDLSAIDGVRPASRTPLPIILGHEAVGEVLEAGSGVADLKPGDRVVTTFVPSCGHCVPCMEGRPALCEPAPTYSASGTLATGGTRFSLKGRRVHHYVGVAAFAEMTVMARPSLVKIDPEVPTEVAALFGCAVLTGVGAVLNTARLKAGESAAVIGLGGVGLSALLGARLAGASHLVAIDLNADKLALAADLGATLTVNAADPDCVARVREATGGGVDFAFEMAGARSAMDVAYRVTRRGGTTVIGSLPAGDVQLPIGHASVVAEERTVKGSYFGSCVPARDIPRLIALYRAGRLPVDRIAGEAVALRDLNAAFDRLAEGKALRQVLIPAS
ncbi:MAG: alcohol dehydrogenase [Betaproteobacteria bacterium]|nr:MAG: alcohol dehydrogenase [Betaproteobacteria bacterium]